MKKFSRRDFIRGSAYALGAFAISAGLQGCDDDDNGGVSALFDQGVASGDPLQDRVIIWTRALPETETATATQVRVSWEVAEDEAFERIIRSGQMEVSAEHDYTLKVDVVGLAPGSRYYYRFRAGRNSSPIGRTSTLPEGAVEQVKLAVVSCANFPAGFFRVYREAANTPDVDALIHLGDYLYEGGDGSFATGDAEPLGRSFPADNNPELLTLAEYRRRYALYRSDADLRAAHASLPFIAVWDDHEVANDAWREGAENHNEGEGDFADRKAAALQAYFEWMPVRPVIEGNREIVYRDFQFGDLVSLYMLDSRLVGRDQQLDFNDFFDEVGNFNDAQFQAEWTDANRSMLGGDQLAWLQNRLLASNATWQVLGQQVLRGRMNLPAELLTLIANPTPENLAQVPPLLEELATIKGRIQAGDTTVTAEERARVETVLPYNLDAWDGYFAERERVLGTALQLEKNLVVLAGDTHNAWANDIKAINFGNLQSDPLEAFNGSIPAGVEFAASSVTSPGFEEFLALPEDMQSIQEIEGAATLLFGENNRFININQRGYLLVTFTPQSAQADWLFLDTVKSEDASIDESRNRSLQVLAGERTLREVDQQV